MQFLYLHGIEPGREDAFRTFIQTLQREHTFVPHSEAVERVRTGRVDGRYLSISFDDGFLSCRTSARILTDAGVSGCYFVCSGLIGSDRDTVRRVFPAGSGAETGTMSWTDLEQLRADGHEIGSHTVHHPVLAEVGHDQLVDEIARSREDLVGPARPGRPLRLAPRAVPALLGRGRPCGARGRLHQLRIGRPGGPCRDHTRPVPVPAPRAPGDDLAPAPPALLRGPRRPAGHRGRQRLAK